MITIPAHERDQVRVFTAALSAEEMQGDKARLAPALLGDADLDPAHVELFDVADLSDIGLTGYLTEGLGVPDATLAADRARLEAMTGPVLILLSKALHGRAVTLSPDPRLALIGTYAEERPPVHFEPLPSPSAQGTLNPNPPAPATSTRMQGVFVLLTLALALTGAVALWLALR
ncbi:hypothetical protein [Tabrizicola aquatica]|uniref:hypothetical protein n=1 Tax=Tabrizicola aquatica TaxID=909926 RepID=UPI000CD2FA21|nr:hypothetical protein [Tabrizicola aquatica]